MRLLAIAALTLSRAALADEPPIRLVTPEDGAVFAAGESIVLEAEPRGAAVGSIQKVEFLNRTVIGEAVGAPVKVAWQNVPPGTYSLSCRATTATGQVESWKSTIAVLPQADKAGVLYVDRNNRTAAADGSIQAPFRQIQDAIAGAQSGDTIKVAAGEYRESVTIQEKNLWLIGGYAGGSAAAYAGGSGGDFTTRTPRSTHVLGEGADQVIDIDFNDSTQWGALDGFTVSGGKLGVNAHTFESALGKYFLLLNNLVTGNTNAANAIGGVAISQVGTCVLSNTISANAALSYAGLFVSGTADTVGLVKGNVVEGNISTEEWSHSAGIAFRGQGTAGTVTRNLVKGNRAYYGAGIFVDGDNGSNFSRVSFNTVLGNKGIFGTGEFVDGGATAIVENEIIAGNETIDGQFGGAFAVDSGPATHAILVNCTVAYNASYYDEFAGGNGLIITEDNSDKVTVEVKNCIFWHNAVLPGAKEMNAPANGILKIDYSNVDQSLTADAHIQVGSGMLRADPLFADPQNFDFHLQSKAGRWNPAAANGLGGWISDAADSPCLDAGDPTSLFQNETSPNGGRINLGAWGNRAEASRSGAGNEGGGEPRLTFTNLRVLSNGGIEISAAGPLGRYQLQMARLLAAAKTAWTNLIVLTNTTGVVTYQDTARPPESSRFFRAQELK